MTKTKKNFKSLFKTFALAFTTFALMLGVFLGNALPQVQAEEADELTNYYTAEKLEEIKISEIKENDMALVNKHLLFDVTNFEEDYSMAPTLLEVYGQDEEDYSHQQKTFYFENNIVSTTNISTEYYTCKYFVGGDSREYVYLRFNNIPDGYEVMIFKQGYAWYINEAIEAPKPEKPSNNRPTTSNKNEDEEKTETGCGSFFEDVGVVVNEVLKIEDTNPLATGIVTISLVAIILVICLAAFKK